MRSHDLLAHMVLIYSQERDIFVPEKLSVIGFDDLPLCRYTMLLNFWLSTYAFTIFPILNSADHTGI